MTSLTSGVRRRALPVASLGKLPGGAGSGLIATLGAGSMALREVRARMARGEPPASAEEYLLRVRIEAEAMPDVLGGRNEDRDEKEDCGETKYTEGENGRGKRVAGQGVEYDGDEIPGVEICNDGEGTDGGKDRGMGRSGALETTRAADGVTQSSSTSPHLRILHLLPDFARCPSHLCPDRDWQRRCASCFSECRQYLRRARSKFPEGAAARAPDLPPLSDGYAWERLCFGKSRGQGKGKTYPPLLSIVLSLGQPELIRLLNRHIKWVSAHDSRSHKGLGDSTVTGTPPPQSPDADSGLSRARAAWLYALMAGLEKPLHRNTAAMLRQLGRYCASVRATSIASVKDPRLASLNVLLTLVEFAFGQGQLSS